MLLASATLAAPLLAQLDPGSLLGSPVPLLIIFVGIFYFMILRPQQKQQADLKKFLDGLQKGDEVVTSGGLIGKIDKVQDGVLFLELASNVRVRVMKNQVLGPFVPAKEGEAAKAEAPEKSSDKK